MLGEGQKGEEAVTEDDGRGMQLQLRTCIKSKKVNFLQSAAHESSTMCAPPSTHSKKQRNKGKCSVMIP